ncbi:MAG: hypothetical protein R3E64_03285 [Halioglobus sp.]
MSLQQATVQSTVQAPSLSRRARFNQWIQDPMGSVIAASVGTMGSLGVVLSGIWLINLTLD